MAKASKKTNRNTVEVSAPGENLPATMTENAFAAIATNPKFKVVKTLTLPSFKLKENEPFYIEALDRMRISKVNKPDPGTGKPSEPATIVTGRNALTGEMGIFLVPAVIKSVWMKDYDGGTVADATVEPKVKENLETGAHLYVGKTFEVVMLPKPPGKRYWGFKVQEVAAADGPEAE